MEKKKKNIKHKKKKKKKKKNNYSQGTGPTLIWFETDDISKNRTILWRIDET